MLGLSLHFLEFDCPNLSLAIWQWLRLSSTLLFDVNPCHPTLTLPDRRQSLLSSKMRTLWKATLGTSGGLVECQMLAVETPPATHLSSGIQLAGQIRRIWSAWSSSPVWRGVLENLLTEIWDYEWISTKDFEEIAEPSFCEVTKFRYLLWDILFCWLNDFFCSIFILCYMTGPHHFA